MADKISSSVFFIYRKERIKIIYFFQRVHNKGILICNHIKHPTYILNFYSSLRIPQNCLTFIVSDIYLKCSLIALIYLSFVEQHPCPCTIISYFSKCLIWSCPHRGSASKRITQYKWQSLYSSHFLHGTKSSL